MVPQDTIGVLRRIIRDRRAGNDMGGASKFESFLEAIAPVQKVIDDKPITIPKQAWELRATVKRLNREAKNVMDPLERGDRLEMRSVAASLKKEFDELLSAAKPELAPLLREANAQHAAAIQKMNSVVPAGYAKLLEQPDSLVKMFIHPGRSIADIRRMESVIGEEGMTAVRGYVLGTMVSTARNNAGQFMPQALGRQIKQWTPEKLKALLTYEQYARLQDLSTVTQSMAKGASIAQGSQTAFIGRVGAEIGFLFSNPALLLKVLAGDAAVSALVGSKVGQRWLTTGYGTEAVSQLTRSLATGAGAQVGR